jgi:hypothetical protein
MESGVLSTPLLLEARKFQAQMESRMKPKKEPAMSFTKTNTGPTLVVSLRRPFQRTTQAEPDRLHTCNNKPIKTWAEWRPRSRFVPATSSSRPISPLSGSELTPQSHPPETSTSTVSPSDDPMSSEDWQLNTIVLLCSEAITHMWALSTD